ncbi:type I DNA topoisomerase [Thermoplasmatales archaeon SW_10_69_26]|nr:MAG: type I DNA topoisomerase [Thermoplasmatales archaeon SW_10_69_26]
MRRVIVVESGAKTRTIRRLVRGEYEVIACGGHIRDLPNDRLGVDVEAGFSYEMQPIRRRGDSQVARLREELQGADEVYLAPDPDREGEAIAADILETAVPSDAEIHRITFNAIVYSAIQDALEEPRGVDEDLVEAQRARSVLDRLIGFILSDMVKYDPEGPRAPSVGRVQSPAVGLVVDREQEIEDFEPREYWTLHARVLHEPEDAEEPQPLTADLDGEIEEDAWDEVTDRVEALAEAGSLTVQWCEVDPEDELVPPPPFTTDTLQNAADGQPLNLSPEETMELAQRLYEGVEIDGTERALITYMRTDSTRVSPEALNRAKSALDQREAFGEELYSGRRWNQGAGAQDAHEAIRPTEPEDPDVWPENLEDDLDPELFELYRLIYWRFLASQMQAAVYRTTILDLDAAGHAAEARGHELTDPGFLTLYDDHLEDPLASTMEPGYRYEEVDVPELETGHELALERAYPEPRRTYPPARYREGRLVSELKERGIGRPSTYGQTLERIKSRGDGAGYVRKRSGTLRPTDKGRRLVDYLRESYSRVIDYEYTARMEEALDAIAEGELSYHAFLEEEFDWLEAPYQRTLDEGWLEGDHPTPAQLEHLDRLSEQTGIDVPDEARSSKAKASEWIDKLLDERVARIELSGIHEAEAGGVDVHRFFVYMRGARLPDELFEELCDEGLFPLAGGEGQPPRMRYQRQDLTRVEKVWRQTRDQLAALDEGDFDEATEIDLPQDP